MPVELSMLAASVGLLFALTLIQRARDFLFPSVSLVAANQQPVQVIQGWHLRLDKAIAKLIEAIVIFAPLVLVAHALGVTSAQSAFGAQLFFVARLLHVVFSVAGALWPRVGACFASLMGMLIIAAGFFH